MRSVENCMLPDRRFIGPSISPGRDHRPIIGRCEWAAPVELPVPDREEHEVREPDDQATVDEVRAAGMSTDDEVVGQEAERNEIRHRHDKN